MGVALKVFCVSFSLYEGAAVCSTHHGVISSGKQYAGMLGRGVCVNFIGVGGGYSEVGSL